MIDLDELHDKMVSYRLVGFTKSDISTIDALELLGKLQQSEKDAARYRWLRQQPCSGWEVDGDETSHIGVTMWRNDGFDNCNSGESLSGGQMDAAIDEAMQCGGEENDHASEESRVDLEGLMFDLGNYKAMLGRAENVIFEAERVLEEYQKNGGIEFDDLIGEIAYYVKYMSKGECSDS